MVSESSNIHPSSIIEDGATIAANVTIGPFCHVGPDVSLAEGVVLKSHVSVTGRTSIGSNTSVFPGAVLGGEPQNIRYKGEETTLSIGSGCTIREGVTMHTGMPDAGGQTVIGDRSMFLAYSHVAHDCQIGDDVILSNNVMLGGHVVIGDRVIIGGGAAIHQFLPYWPPCLPQRPLRLRLGSDSLRHAGGKPRYSDRAERYRHATLRHQQRRYSARSSGVQENLLWPRDDPRIRCRNPRRVWRRAGAH